MSGCERCQTLPDGHTRAVECPGIAVQLKGPVCTQEERLNLERQLSRSTVADKCPASCAFRTATSSVLSHSFIRAASRSRIGPGWLSNSAEAAAKKHPPRNTTRPAYSSQESHRAHSLGSPRGAIIAFRTTASMKIYRACSIMAS
jgi:hypothetical protein